MDGPPAGIDLSASEVPRILGVNIATFLLAVIAIILRFIARRLTRAAFWWDDWLMLPAIIFAALMCLVSLTYMIDHGLGRHIWIAPPDAALVWAKGLFISEICYTVIICSNRFSVLAFYWRIFKPSKIRIPIYLLVASVSCWGVAVLLVTILQCQPVSAFWTRFSPTGTGSFRCGVNVNMFFNGNSIPNIITDALLLVLPLPFVWQLQLPRAQKVALTSIFIVGIIVVAMSIVRYIYILKLDLASPDITWNFVNVQIWTGLESHANIVCACLPSLRPILNLILTGSVNRGHGHGRKHSDDKALNCLSARSFNIWDSHMKRHQMIASEATDRESSRGFARFPEGGNDGQTYISASAVALEDLHLQDGIQVRTEIVIDGERDK